jgi:hypothetical protein
LLDFTLSDGAHLDAEFLKRMFSEMGAKLYEDIGLQIPADQLRFDVYHNSRSGPCQSSHSPDRNLSGQKKDPLPTT